MTVARWMLPQKPVSDGEFRKFKARLCIKLVQHPYPYFGSFFGISRNLSADAILKSKKVDDIVDIIDKISLEMIFIWRRFHTNIFFDDKKYQAIDGLFKEYYYQFQNLIDFQLVLLYLQCEMFGAAPLGTDYRRLLLLHPSCVVKGVLDATEFPGITERDSKK